MQAPHVSRNKPFHSLAMEKTDQLLAEEGINQLTSAATLKSPPHHTIVHWILKA